MQVVHLSWNPIGHMFNDGLYRSQLVGLKKTKRKKNCVLLDSGCGDGKVGEEWKEVLSPREMIQMDILYGHDLNQPLSLPDKSVDFILSSQLIEHLYNTRLYLCECYRVLKKGGQLLLMTENLSSWCNILSLFFGWQPFSTTSIEGLSIGNPLAWKRITNIEHEESNGSHIRILSYQGLYDLLKRVGFRGVKIYSRGYFPFWGWLSDFLCGVDKRHGHFLISTATK